MLLVFVYFQGVMLPTHLEKIEDLVYLGYLERGLDAIL